MVEVLRVGYCLPFLSPPPLSSAPLPMPSYSPTSIKGAALEEVTLGLVVKGAVESCWELPRLEHAALASSSARVGLTSVRP